MACLILSNGFVCEMVCNLDGEYPVASVHMGVYTSSALLLASTGLRACGLCVMCKTGFQVEWHMQYSEVQLGRLL